MNAHSNPMKNPMNQMKKIGITIGVGVLQAGIGLPVLPAAIEGWRGKVQKPMFGGFMSAPRSANDLDDWNFTTASGFDMGTLYTMVAGLLNILVIFDAFAGPLPPPIQKPDKKKDKTDKSREGTGETAAT